ncbi:MULTISPECIES: MerR family transcriptional regulator [unclassified Pseudofrankia]|uniref:MerR family transcriptional regulator n=1 Tax=unclassified Pseudofrankia TaxID=2994372 RepID=UPI000ADF2767|nr:MerR family transcriptional regulator [Pseudofrankia sp. BMG5.37]
MFTARRDPDASTNDAATAAPSTVLQIGDVARQVGLSLRTVRFYEEAGLLTPVGRTQGGFRLYDEDALDRLLLIKRMKPLGFTLEEMRSLLAVRDELRLPDLTADRQHELRERLKTWATLAEEKLADLRARAGIAADFVAGLHDDASRLPDSPDDLTDVVAHSGATDTAPIAGDSATTCDDGDSDGVARAITAHSPDGPEHDAPSTETSPDRT